MAALPIGVDPKSDAPDAQSDEMRRYKGDAGARAALATTTKLSDVDLDGNPPGPLRGSAQEVASGLLQILTLWFLMAQN